MVECVCIFHLSELRNETQNIKKGKSYSILSTLNAWNSRKQCIFFHSESNLISVLLAILFQVHRTKVEALCSLRD